LHQVGHLDGSLLFALFDPGVYDGRKDI
jgi:hypothetical protein